MKKLKIAFLLGFISLVANAQKIIEKNFDYQNQTIMVEVKFASQIEVKTWDKKSVYFKADLTTKDGKFLDAYQLDIAENTNSLSISSEAEPVFRKFQDEWNKNNPTKKKRYYNSSDWYNFTYVLYVPKNAKFKISSINGDLKSERIEGHFTADLINGDIEIKKYGGNLDLNTINGAIDISMKNTSLIAETIHGNIYADENLKIKTTDKHVGQKVVGSFNNAAHSLRLKTINGNMYLRL